MIMRSSRFKAALVMAVAVALGAPLSACSDDGSPGDQPDGGSDEETGGKASGGSAGKGTGGSAAGSTGSGGTMGGTGGSKGGAGGSTGGASGGRAGSGGSAAGAGGAAGGAGTLADSGTDGADGCIATESLTPPTTPDAIKPPAGTTLLHHYHAKGTQNYTCTATPGTGGADPTYGYGASTPEALLYDSCGKEVIHHFGGPTWQSLADSSSVKGAKLAGVDVTGSIPLLLLKGTPQTATGDLSEVSYIQRLDTTGGAAPAAATCTAAHVGEVTKVEYTANYYFYEGPDADAGCVATESLTPPTTPDAIKPPDGTNLVHHFHAIGTQNYTCTATPGTGGADPTYGYGASTPEALLYDSCGKEVIHHFGGPTWQWLADSSSVKGAKLAGVDVTGSIPLLLLKGTPQTATGELSEVSYIQRLDTTGGVAPAASACTQANVGEVTKVNYTANYYFYEGPPAVDAGN